MSDEAAPVEAVEPPPSAEVSPSETKEAPKAEPTKAKPKTEDEEQDEYFRKKPLKYKAGGKEKTISSAAELRQMLSRVSGVDSAASEALKAKKEADGLKATLANIAKMPPRERLGAMQAAGIDPKLIREAVEESILDEDEKSRAQAHLSPREREYEAKLQEREAELAKFREEQERAEQEREQAAETERIGKIGQRLEKVAVGALQKAKIAGEHAPQFLQAIADRLDRNERLGLELDEGEVADVVMKEHETLADQYYSGLELPALAEKLEAQMVDDPDKPGAKISRLKLLMRHEAAKIKARLNGVPVATRPVSAKPAAGPQQTDADKWAASRTWGGGTF